MSEAETLPVPAAVPPPPARLVPGPIRAADLSLSEKATLVLAALGPDGAAGILSQLGEANIRRFARIVSRMGVIPGAVLDEVVAEFLTEIGGMSDVNGGIATAKRMLSSALDRETYDRIMADVQTATNTTIWDRLGKAPIGPLANFIAGEHPQVGAVVLSRMRPDLAARVLERLPAQVAQPVVLRMKRAPRIDTAVMEVLKQVIEGEFLSVIRRAGASKKPAELLAGLMNHVSGAAREGFLAELEADEPSFAAEVQRVMFTFADITARVNPRDITAITRGVEEELLMAALKTGMETHPQVCEFILGSLSKRLSERILEDLEAMMPVPLKEGEAAQAELIKVIQALAQRGEIKLNQPEAPED